MRAARRMRVAGRVHGRMASISRAGAEAGFDRPVHVTAPSSGDVRPGERDAPLHALELGDPPEPGSGAVRRPGLPGERILEPSRGLRPPRRERPATDPRWPGPPAQGRKGRGLLQTDRTRGRPSRHPVWTSNVSTNDNGKPIGRRREHRREAAGELGPDLDAEADDSFACRVLLGVGENSGSKCTDPSVFTGTATIAAEAVRSPSEVCSVTPASLWAIPSTRVPRRTSARRSAAIASTSVRVPPRSAHRPFVSKTISPTKPASANVLAMLR